MKHRVAFIGESTDPTTGRLRKIPILSQEAASPAEAETIIANNMRLPVTKATAALLLGNKDPSAELIGIGVMTVNGHDTLDLKVEFGSVGQKINRRVHRILDGLKGAFSDASATHPSLAEQPVTIVPDHHKGKISRRSPENGPIIPAA